MLNAFFTPVDLKLLWAWELPGGLFGTQVAGPTLMVSDSVVLAWGMIICISNKLPDDVDPSNLGTMLWRPLTYINSFKIYKDSVRYYIPSCLDGDTDVGEVKQIRSELWFEPKTVWTWVLPLTIEHTALRDSWLLQIPMFVVYKWQNPKECHPEWSERKTNIVY